MEYVIHIFRIQNMKVVDGVPEYKNGFVSFSRGILAVGTVFPSFN
jgi:hypothetical protein